MLPCASSVVSVFPNHFSIFSVSNYGHEHSPLSFSSTLKSLAAAQYGLYILLLDLANLGEAELCKSLMLLPRIALTLLPRPLVLP